jgi:hypothetical protein
VGAGEVKFIIEDTPMAVSKKSLPISSPIAKTTKTKSYKSAEVSPITSASLKTANGDRHGGRRLRFGHSGITCVKSLMQFERGPRIDLPQQLSGLIFNLP